MAPEFTFPDGHFDGAHGYKVDAALMPEKHGSLHRHRRHRGVTVELGLAHRGIPPGYGRK